MPFDCFKCYAPNLKEKEFKTACSKCRDFLKYELVRKILTLDKVYLSEANRNKKGRKKILGAAVECEIKRRYENNPKENSYGKLAKKYGVSKTTISNIINSKR